MLRERIRRARGNAAPPEPRVILTVVNPDPPEADRVALPPQAVDPPAAPRSAQQAAVVPPQPAIPFRRPRRNAGSLPQDRLSRPQGALPLGLGRMRRMEIRLAAAPIPQQAPAIPPPETPIRVQQPPAAPAPRRNSIPAQQQAPVVPGPRSAVIQVQQPGPAAPVRRVTVTVREILQILRARPAPAARPAVIAPQPVRPGSIGGMLADIIARPVARGPRRAAVSTPPRNDRENQLQAGCEHRYNSTYDMFRCQGTCGRSTPQSAGFRCSRCGVLHCTRCRI